PRPLGPVGSGHALPLGPAAAARPSPAAPAPGAAPDRDPGTRTEGATAVRPGPATVLHQSFTVDHPRDRVFAFFGRLEEVVACMPGAALTKPPEGSQVQGRLRVKLGPIAADFAGEAEVERDPARHSGVIRGQGRDARTGSSAIGEVT